MTLGTRVEEVLQLKRRNVILRNGVHGLALGLDPDQHAKTTDSERVVPIPQLLLDLGFVEWVRGKDGADALPFPDAAERAAGATLSGAFGKHLRHLYKKLGIADFDEDFYALRKTLSTELARLDVSDGRHQAIDGHEGGAIIDRHDTAHHAADLKRDLDRVDLRLEIRTCAQRGFPVILGCGLAAGPVVEVDVALGEDGGVCAVRLTDAAGADLLAARVHGAGRAPAEWSDRPALSLDAIQARLREALATARVRLPRDPRRQRAFEHLWAMARRRGPRSHDSQIVHRHPERVADGARPDLAGPRPARLGGASGAAEPLGRRTRRRARRAAVPERRDEGAGGRQALGMAPLHARRGHRRGEALGPPARPALGPRRRQRALEPDAALPAARRGPSRRRPALGRPDQRRALAPLLAGRAVGLPSSSSRSTSPPSSGCAATSSARPWRRRTAGAGCACSP